MSGDFTHRSFLFSLSLLLLFVNINVFGVDDVIIARARCASASIAAGARRRSLLAAGFAGRSRTV
jgi:hypothetical protein